MQALLKSRKFLLLCLDTVISLILFAVGQFWPTALDSLKVLIAMLQPVFVAIIIAISVEDAAALKAGAHPNQLATSTVDPAVTARLNNS